MSAEIDKTTSRELAICAKCRHQGWGKGVLPPRVVRPGQLLPSQLRSTTERGDRICMKHQRGRTPIDPVTGYGGEVKALYCEDVNKDGACPDYKRGAKEGDVVTLAMILSAIAAVLILVLAIMGASR